MVTEKGVRSATRDGVKLAYLDTGSGEPALVFIHGWCCSHIHWRDQIPEFSQRHRVVAVDLRGLGESDVPDEDSSVPQFVDDVAWLIREIGLEKPVLIGHSMGGQIALNVVRKYPDLARGAVFVDAVMMPVGEEMKPLIAQTIEAMKTPAYKEVATNVVKLFLFRPESPPDLRDEVAASMADTPQRVMQTAFASTTSEENYPAGPVPVPSLFVRAATLQATEEQITERYPGMETVSMDAAHFVHMEKPEEFNAILARFLEKVG